MIVIHYRNYIINLYQGTMNPVWYCHIVHGLDKSVLHVTASLQKPSDALALAETFIDAKLNITNQLPPLEKLSQ